MTALAQAEWAVDEIETMRPRVPGNERVDLNLVNAIINRLGSRPDVAAECCRQAKQYLTNSNDSLYVSHVPLENDFGLLVTFIKVPKAPDAYFEAMVYQKVNAGTLGSEQFPSQAYPVIVHKCTTGLAANNLLGFFAENVGYGRATQRNHPDAKAIYLVDRFALRFNSVTAAAIQCGTSSGCLSQLKTLVNDADLRHWASWWLYLHEYFHSTGLMPYYDHIEVKRSTYGAGFEETRVDLLSILTLLKDGTDQSRSISQYILAERLLTYPLVDLRDGVGRPVFDAVGSVYLLTQLVEAGVVSIVDSVIRIAPNWPEGIANILKRMEDVERSLLLTPVSQRRALLEKHVAQVSQKELASLPRTPMKSGFRLPNIYFDIHARIETTS